jgi:hypothetical protein
MQAREMKVVALAAQRSSSMFSSHISHLNPIQTLGRAFGTNPLHSCNVI